VDSAVNRGQLVLAAGLGSMLRIRSKFFTVNVGNDDVAFGPEQLVRVFLGFPGRSHVVLSRRSSLVSLQSSVRRGPANLVGAAPTAD
jgi:hypothetical protein